MGTSDMLYCPKVCAHARDGHIHLDDMENAVVRCALWASGECKACDRLNAARMPVLTEESGTCTLNEEEVGDD